MTNFMITFIDIIPKIREWYWGQSGKVFIVQKLHRLLEKEEERNHLQYYWFSDLPNRVVCSWHDRFEISKFSLLPENQVCLRLIDWVIPSQAVCAASVHIDLILCDVRHKVSTLGPTLLLPQKANGVMNTVGKYSEGESPNAEKSLPGMWLFFLLSCSSHNTVDQERQEH